jgi:AraC-like DNA-binding protein
MGDAGSLKHDLTMTLNGEVDPANRTMLLMMLNDSASGPSLLPFAPNARLKALVIDALSMYKGRVVEQASESTLVGVFDSPASALSCAEDLFILLKRYINEDHPGLIFRIALHSGLPLTHEGGFFEKPIKRTQRLCQASQPNQMIMSAKLNGMLENEADELLDKSSKEMKVLSESEEKFLHDLFDHIELNLHKETFNVNLLGRLMGISRPQLYRKTLALTGRSPNHLIRDFRMEQAWNMLKNKIGNISEVALAVGYVNSSYFGKIFHEKFGFNPSGLLAHELLRKP